MKSRIPWFMAINLTLRQFFPPKTSPMNILAGKRTQQHCLRYNRQVSNTVYATTDKSAALFALRQTSQQHCLRYNRQVSSTVCATTVKSAALFTLQQTSQQHCLRYNRQVSSTVYATTDKSAALFMLQHTSRELSGCFELRTMGDKRRLRDQCLCRLVKQIVRTRGSA